MTLALRDPPAPDSPLARWDARWKLAGLLALSAGASLLETPGPLAALLALTAALAVVGGRIAVTAVVGRALLLALPVAPLLVVLPLADGRRGGLVAAAVSARLVAVGLTALVLIRTTGFPTLLAAAQGLRVPGVLVAVAQAAYRYSFVLAGEARRTRVALRTRGFRLRSDRRTYQTVGYSVGALLVRSADRAETVAAAMRVRGFSGAFHTTTAFRTTAADVVGFAAAIAAVAGLVAWDRGSAGDE